MKVLKKPMILIMILWTSIISTNLMAETISLNPDFQDNKCEVLLSKCAQLAKIQKKAIDDQKETIFSQDKLILEQEKQIDELEDENDVRTAIGVGSNALLLLLLILL